MLPIFVCCLIFGCAFSTSMCLLRNMKSKDDGFNAAMSGGVSGVGLVFERASRRNELVLYTVPYVCVFVVVVDCRCCKVCIVWRISVDWVLLCRIGMLVCLGCLLVYVRIMLMICKVLSQKA